MPSGYSYYIGRLKAWQGCQDKTSTHKDYKYTIGTALIFKQTRITAIPSKYQYYYLQSKTFGQKFESNMLTLLDDIFTNFFSSNKRQQFQSLNRNVSTRLLETVHNCFEVQLAVCLLHTTTQFIRGCAYWKMKMEIDGESIAALCQ